LILELGIRIKIPNDDIDNHKKMNKSQKNMIKKSEYVSEYVFQEQGVTV